MATNTAISSMTVEDITALVNKLVASAAFNSSVVATVASQMANISNAARANASSLDTVSQISAGDTAWMLTSTALVLLMTIPGEFLIMAVCTFDTKYPFPCEIQRFYNNFIRKT